MKSGADLDSDPAELTDTKQVRTVLRETGNPGMGKLEKTEIYKAKIE